MSAASLSDFLFDFRNRLLASPRFRSWAQKVPFFRAVARRRAVQLFVLTSGFVHSQVLRACVAIRLFDQLRDGARSVADIAAGSNTDPDRLAHLLRAAAALQLVSKRAHNEYGLGPLGAALSGNAGLAALIEHHDMFYSDLADPVAILRPGGPATALSKLWPYASGASTPALEREDVAAYTSLMAASQSMVAEQLLAVFPLRGRRQLLDLGGGAGVFAIAAAQRWPHLNATVAELPAVADIARRRIQQSGLQDRIRVLEIDGEGAPIAPEFDAVSLVRIVHDHDDEAALSILRTARSALTEKGYLLIGEPLADAPGAGEVLSAYFSMYFLAMGSGRPRTSGEIGALCRQAGFHRIRVRRTAVPLITGAMTARPMT